MAQNHATVVVSEAHFPTLLLALDGEGNQTGQEQLNHWNLRIIDSILFVRVWVIWLYAFTCLPRLPASLSLFSFNNNHIGFSSFNVLECPNKRRLNIFWVFVAVSIHITNQKRVSQITHTLHAYICETLCVYICVGGLCIAIVFNINLNKYCCQFKLIMISFSSEEMWRANLVHQSPVISQFSYFVLMFHSHSYDCGASKHFKTQTSL